MPKDDLPTIFRISNQQYGVRYFGEERGPFDRDAACQERDRWIEDINGKREIALRYKTSTYWRILKASKKKKPDPDLKDFVPPPKPPVRSHPQGDYWFSPFTAVPEPPTQEEIDSWNKAYQHSLKRHKANKKAQRIAKRNRINGKKGSAELERKGSATKDAVMSLWDQLERDGIPKHKRTGIIAGQLNLNQDYIARVIRKVLG